MLKRTLVYLRFDFFVIQYKPLNSSKSSHKPRKTCLNRRWEDFNKTLKICNLIWN